MAELNEDKCKELRIDFSRKQTQANRLNPIRINGKEIEVVTRKPRENIRSYSQQWLQVKNAPQHVDNIVSKASKRLYLITQFEFLQMKLLKYIVHAGIRYWNTPHLFFITPYRNI